MPRKKKNIIKKTIDKKEVRIAFENFPDPLKLVELLKKIDQWKSDEPLLTFKNSRGENLIHAIILAPKELKLVSYIPLLKAKGMDLDDRSQRLPPLIFFAIKLQHKEAIQSLYFAGADLNYEDIDGDNVLDRALATQSCDICHLISLLLSLKGIETLKAGFFLRKLAGSDNPEALGLINKFSKLAQESKITVDINSQNPLNKRTPLMVATNAKKLDVVNYLIESKANLYLEDFQGFNVLTHAIFIGEDNVLNAILSADDNIKLINQVPSMGHTPLQVAVAENPKFINLLLEKKADINAKNNKGDTVLHTAIAYNKLALIIDQPSLNILNLSRSQRLDCLSLAVACSDVAVLEQLFKVSGLTPDSFLSEEIASLYELAIKLKKESHFKFMVKRKLNVNIFPENFFNINPLAICCQYEKTGLIKWFFEHTEIHSSLTAVFLFLEKAIINHEKKLVVLLLDLVIDPLLKIKILESQYYLYLRNKMAVLCLINNWVNLSIRFQSALKLLLNCNLFERFSKFELMKIIFYLEGIFRFKFLNMEFAENEILASRFYSLQTTDFLPILNRIPGMIDYIPDWKNPDYWIELFYLSQPLTNLTYILPITDSRTKALTSFSFFKEQGLSDIEIKEILRENKEHKETSMLTFLNSEQTQKNIPLPCTWFGGQLSSHDDRLQRIEGINIPNAFLLIPDSLKNIMRLSKARHFNPDQGLQPLEGMPAVKVILKFNGNENTIEYKTKFTHEIKYVSTSDRILCVTVKPDRPEQRGILILAVHYLPNGLHHHGTQSQLPTIVRVLMPTATSSTNQAGFN